MDTRNRWHQFEKVMCINIDGVDYSRNLGGSRHDGIEGAIATARHGIAENVQEA